MWYSVWAEYPPFLSILQFMNNKRLKKSSDIHLAQLSLNNCMTSSFIGTLQENVSYSFSLCVPSTWLSGLSWMKTYCWQIYRLFEDIMQFTDTVRKTKLFKAEKSTVSSYLFCNSWLRLGGSGNPLRVMTPAVPLLSLMSYFFCLIFYFYHLKVLSYDWHV